MLAAECEWHGIEFAWSATHLNVSQVVALMGGWMRETGTLRAVRRLRLELIPATVQHQGSDEALGIGRMLGLARRGLRG